MNLLSRIPLALAIALLVTLSSTQGQETPARKDKSPAPPAPEGPVVIRLAKQAKGSPRALAYRLTADPLEEMDGNAAQLWLRACMDVRNVHYKWTEKEWKWDGPNGTALKDLPQKDIKALLLQYATPLDLADLAALRTRCHWDNPPLTIQTLGTAISLPQIQAMRELAQRVNLRCRLELAEKRFDAAGKSVRTGFSMARHTSDGKVLIKDLVGIAIASIMLGRLEEWVQIPDSPNLYWPLTELPRPLINVRRSIRNELYTFDRSLPTLRKLKAKLTPEQARQLADEYLDLWGQCIGVLGPEQLKGVARTAAALRYHPTARKALIVGGRSEKEVDAMPKLQVVALYFVEDYDRVRDEICKWLCVPALRGLPEIEKIMAREKNRSKENTNVFLGLLIPAISKVVQAQTRLDRQIASLRAAEALRQHVADHGKPPARWADLKSLPLPIDPLTGKGFDAFYKVVEGKAILDIPAMPGMPANIGRRFEIDTQGR